jgi:hypothetical protein
VKDAALKTKGPVIQLGKDNYINAKNIKKYSVTGRRKDMKISALSTIFFHPASPYGQNNKKNKRNLSIAKKTNRTLHSWLIAIEKDDESLEMLNIGTKSNLRASHTEQKRPPAFPTGLQNDLWDSKTRFNINTRLTNLGTLSDALIGIRS